MTIFDRFRSREPADAFSSDGPLTRHLPGETVAINENGRRLLAARFLRQDGTGQPVERPEDLFRRVAQALAAVEPQHERALWERHFEAVMFRMIFHPGSRVLANAGRPLAQLANCFVFPLADDQRAILDTFSQSTYVKSHGGGCGFNFSAIRPKGDMVRGIGGLATGPVEYVRLFDRASELVRQQGHYECGNMSILNADHPDIFDFVSLKRCDGTLRLTNISVGAGDAFMRAVAEDAGWSLVHPRTRSVVRTLPARELFDAMCDSACESGDPGLVFLDRLNANNPLRESCGDIQATNTCGEIGLYPFESCNLGYLNLPSCLLPFDAASRRDVFDWPKLESAVALAVRMLDDAISASWFPLEQIRESVLANRRIGIGVTGWADCLAYYEIPYDSEEALVLAQALAHRMYTAAFQASCDLAKERGPFPNAEKSIWRSSRDQPRNVALLALPPSGNNALIFDTSFSIEPFFALTFRERVLDGSSITHTNAVLGDVLRRYGLDPGTVLTHVEAAGGSIQDAPAVPPHLKRCFKTAGEIEPRDHVRMQAAFQAFVDNAVTKTVNLPATATPHHVAAVYLASWSLGCKGITVYRDGCRSGQSMSATPSTGRQEPSCATCPA